MAINYAWINFTKQNNSLWRNCFRLIGRNLNSLAIQLSAFFSVCIEFFVFYHYCNLQTSKVPLNRQAQGTSLFTSAAYSLIWVVSQFARLWLFLAYVCIVYSLSEKKTIFWQMRCNDTTSQWADHISLRSKWFNFYFAACPVSFQCDGLPLICRIIPLIKISMQHIFLCVIFIVYSFLFIIILFLYNMYFFLLSFIVWSICRILFVPLGSRNWWSVSNIIGWTYDEQFSILLAYY